MVTCEPEKKEALQSDVEKEISLRLEASAKIGEDGGDRAVEALVKPKTAVQFDAAWRRLGGPAARAKYLGLLRESDYPVVFKHSLEPRETIIQCCRELYIFDVRFKGRATLSKINYKF